MEARIHLTYSGFPQCRNRQHRCYAVAYSEEEEIDPQGSIFLCGCYYTPHLSHHLFNSTTQPHLITSIYFSFDKRQYMTLTNKHTSPSKATMRDVREIRTLIADNLYLESIKLRIGGRSKLLDERMQRNCEKITMIYHGSNKYNVPIGHN